MDLNIQQAGENITEFRNRNKIIILVVEDDEVSYILIREILASMGMTTVRATSKDEVFKLVNTTKDFSLIVMDVFLNGSDNGYAIANELSDRKVDLPIMIVSAFTTSVYLPERRILNNIKEVMDKPFDITNFKELLLKTLKVK
jgi:CheY-like chemotaxis protein